MFSPCLFAVVRLPVCVCVCVRLRAWFGLLGRSWLQSCGSIPRCQQVVSQQLQRPAGHGCTLSSAFESCKWQEARGSEKELEEYRSSAHAVDSQPICEKMLMGNVANAMLSAYNQAVAVKCRGQAPIAGASLDRAALGSFAQATRNNRVAALVCFSCGSVRPYVKKKRAGGTLIGTSRSSAMNRVENFPF